MTLGFIVKGKVFGKDGRLDPGLFVGKRNIQWKCLENRFVGKKKQKQPPGLERTDHE